MKKVCDPANHTSGLDGAGRRVAEIICSLFLIAVLFVFPLYYRDFYFDILPAKYQFYYISVLAMAGGLLALGLVLLAVDRVRFGGVYSRTWFREFRLSRLAGSLNATDVALAIFLLVAVISTIQSDYIYESFWGNEGRYTGLFLLLLYGLSFWMVTRTSRGSGRILEVFLMASLLAALFGITDFFDLNLLHFKDRIAREQYSIFTSTFGNINTYTAFLSLALGMASVLFALEKNLKRSVWYYICMAVTMAAIITGQSDNAYLALLALFGFLPLFLFKDWQGVKRYFIIAASFFSVIQGIDTVSQVMSGQVMELDGLFRVIVRLPGLEFIVIALWALVAVLYWSEKRIGDRLTKKGRLQIAWGGLLAVAALGIILILIDANLLGHEERYGALRNYVIFDDEWGTHRGYIWRIGIENYMDFPLLHKLFGYGPDTYGIITTNNNYAEMVSRYEEIFDSAHNEYLQYFVTIGPIGLGAYLAFLGTAFWKMLRMGRENIYLAGAAFAVLCYGAQAFVNINLPIATPVMWTILMVGMAGCRKRKTDGK